MAPLPHYPFTAHRSDESLRFPERESSVGTATEDEKRNALVEFCYRAHSEILDLARRQHVRADILERLSVRPANGGPSVLTLSDDDRVALLGLAIPHYEATFPDFIELAKRVAGRYENEASRARRDSPEVFAGELGELLTIKMITATSNENCQLNMVLLASLAQSIRGVMRSTSNDISDSLRRTLKSGAETPLGFR